MAYRAKPKKKTAAKGKIPSRGKVATLPRQSKGRSRRKGHNSGDLHALGDDDVLYHQEQLDAARKRMKTAQAEVTQLRDVYQSKRKTAKQAGFNLNAYDINAAVEVQDSGKVQQDYADAGRYLKVRGHVLAEQLQLFQNMEPPAPGPIDPFERGIGDGKAAVDADKNPYDPGSNEFQRWAEGWVQGQAQNASKIGKADPATLN